MPRIPVLGAFEHVGNGLVLGDGLECERRNERSRFFRQYDLDVDRFFLEKTDDLACLVGRDTAGHTENYGLALFHLSPFTL